MTLSIIQNPELVEAIEENLKNSRYYGYVNRVLSQNLRDYITYLWGGAVRDPIVKRIYGKRKIRETRDFDILVDDSDGRIDFRELLRDLGNVEYTRFGSPKWKPIEGLEIDITPFSNTLVSINGTIRPTDEEKLPISLESALKNCDFTTNSLAYHLRQRMIYNYLALRGIELQEIELLYPREEAYTLMCRLALQSDRLGFGLGTRAKGLIAEGYTPDLDEQIRRYLEHIDRQDEYQFVVERLREIQATVLGQE